MIDRRPWLNVLSHAVMLIGVLIVAFPLYLAFIASTHTAQEIVQAPMPLLPGSNMWESYRAALLGSGKLGSNTTVAHMMWVSFVTAMVITVGKIAISLLSAFAIVFFRFPFKMLCFWAIFVTLMLPVEVRILPTRSGEMVITHLIVDTRDAMGANAVNTACERLAPQIEAITGGKVHLRILSNLSDRRMARARCTIPVSELTVGFETFKGETVRDGIIAAYAFAASDPYRAATHNKGIMNGVDAVVLATGNDWRAIEAGAHAYAARSGKYTSLSTWGKDQDGNLVGTLEMPMAVGIVGGATKVHPAAQAAVKLMGVKTANELAQIIVSVGLAQNMAALRALATEGIQRGHMSLHARQIALAAGAAGEMIERVAAQMVAEKAIRVSRAEEILLEMQKI